MSEALVLSVLKDALITSIMISAPIILTAVLVGLIISIFQATTQIQEQTLTFVPKIVIAGIVGIIFGGWMMNKGIQFTTRIFELISNITK
ncbi:flagellar biosynthetic protein FliQ [Hathewaya proteolytica DSM 3090]|uniref:Flagellar biosynthetic protein FliQ n=1 Tax=Hathewaya proteolytica DSM 3090 TaxID=1121331 RepID=A0A1M6L9H7_9CLOT|nr:flagellar biosynthesis protein FliQ [Hathewaya proteolytica]SHJ67851.1 flagellar biosynthetic protein FliQ [Hathewaya proteolytica DSM 3090]